MKHRDLGGTQSVGMIIMPFAVTEIVILSEISQRKRQISYGIAYMLNLGKNDTAELIYKTETESQT